jgi:hypothetical protein
MVRSHLLSKREIGASGTSSWVVAMYAEYIDMRCGCMLVKCSFHFIFFLSHFPFFQSLVQGLFLLMQASALS